MDRFTRIVFAVSLLFYQIASITENECTVSLEFNDKNRLIALGVFSRDSLSIPSGLDLTELNTLTVVGSDYGGSGLNDRPVDIAECIRDERLGDLTNVKILNFQLDVSKLTSDRAIQSECLELACKDLRSLENCLSFFSAEKLKQLDVTLKELDNCDYKFISDFPELVSISIYSRSNTSLNARQFLKNVDLSRVKTLQLSGFVITNEDMTQFQNMNVLQTLGFKWCTIPAGANQILAGLNSLESLSVEYCNIGGGPETANNDAEVVFKKLKILKLGVHGEPYQIEKMSTPEIQSLTIFGSLDLNDLSNLGLKKLRSLSLNHIPYEFDEQHARIVRKCHTSLEEIGFSYSGLSSASLEKLSGLPNLKSLKLSHLEVFDGKPVFQRNGKIAHLELGNLDVYPSRHEISKLTQLRSLTVRGGKQTYLPLEGLELLALSYVDLSDTKIETFNGLRELSISGGSLPEFGKSNSLSTNVKRISLDFGYLSESTMTTVPLNPVISETLSMLIASGYSIRVKTETGTTNN